MNVSVRGPRNVSLPTPDSPWARPRRLGGVPPAVSATLFLSAALSLLAPSPAEGQVLRETTFTKPHGDVRQVAFSPDGKTLASIGINHAGKFPHVRLWDVETGKEKALLRLQAPHCGSLLAFTPDGKSLVSSCGQSPSTTAPGFTMIEVWDVKAGKRRLAIKTSGRGSRGAIGGDGRVLVVTARDASAALYDLQTGKELAVLAGHNGANLLALSRDGKWLATGCSKGKLGIWDLGKRKLLHLFDAQKRGVTALAISPDGKRVASIGDDVVLNVWDRATGGREVRRDLGGRVGEITMLRFTPAGDALVLAGQVRRSGVGWWEIAGGRLRGDLNAPRSAPSVNLRGAALSPDGKLVAGMNNATLQLWDLREKPKKP